LTLFGFARERNLLLTSMQRSLAAPIALAVATLLLAARADAQQVALCDTTAAADSVALAPDLIIRASASADAVRFDSQPRVDVRLTGCAAADSIRVLERRNLPDPVQPGVTYNDVFVAVEILGHLDVECLLEDLGLELSADSSAAAGSLLSEICGRTVPDSVPATPAPR
jgi:hypothetical protein